ncbi:MAG: hypothetical protein Q8Q37_01375 [bacterium]|nr:hypothetical protein [bacterium]
MADEIKINTNSSENTNNDTRPVRIDPTPPIPRPPQQPFKPTPPPPPKPQPVPPPSPTPTIHKAEEDFKIRTMNSDLRTEANEVMSPSDNKESASLESSTTVQMPSAVIEEEPPKAKAWYYVIVSIIIIAVLAVIGYFVVYPLLTPSEQPTDSEAEENPPTTVIAKPHQSYFILSPAVSQAVRLTNVDLSEISFALQTESLQPLTEGAIKELAILDDQANQISFATYISQLVPSLDSSKLNGLLDSDFTAFLHYDTRGVWPGYIAKIKSGIDSNELKNEISKLEATNLASLYINPSGELSLFKDGKVGFYDTRYALGERPGAAFNYGYFNDYLILSTSYNGLKAALTLLGL